MTSQLAGILMIGAFYALFFAVGSLANRRCRTVSSEEFLLAGRNLPLWVGILTMTATWVGGGYLNGTAEAVADPSRGLIWAQAPWGYALSLILGGIFFAGKMRRYGFKTMLDLFHFRYGQRVAALLFIPSVLGELFWSAAILTALGTTFGTILGLDFDISIVISAAVAVSYTFLGGLRSVAYTDVLQILFIVMGLSVLLPFAINCGGGLGSILQNYSNQFGDSASLMPPDSAWGGGNPWAWRWTDSGLLLIFGGIPWQVYFQRVLASRNPRSAVQLSVAAGFACLIVAIPAVLIGLIGGTYDWSQLPEGGPSSPAMVLPFVLRYLTPPVAAIFGLTAVAAAVMSSVDSSILSASTLFSWNVYRPLWQGESKDEFTTRRVTRIAVVVIGFSATTLALTVKSVYTLWFLCADLVYVLLFPQLLLALYCRHSNQVGVVVGIVVALILRLGAGESSLGVDSFISYPFQDQNQGTFFPYRTFAMLMGMGTTWIISYLTRRQNPPRDLDQEIFGKRPQTGEES